MMMHVRYLKINIMVYIQNYSCIKIRMSARAYVLYNIKKTRL